MLIRTEALFRLDRHDALPADGSGVVHKNFDDRLFNLGLAFPFGPGPHPSAGLSEQPVRVVPVDGL